MHTYFSAHVSFLEELVTYPPPNPNFISHLPSLFAPIGPTSSELNSHFHLFPISSGADVFILAQQQVLERLFERGVAQRVTSRVDGRVDVTQPVADCPHGVWHTGLAEGRDQHHDVVRCPRNDERQQDGKDSLGHL